MVWQLGLFHGSHAHNLECKLANPTRQIHRTESVVAECPPAIKRGNGKPPRTDNFIQ